VERRDAAIHKWKSPLNQCAGNDGHKLISVPLVRFLGSQVAAQSLHLPEFFIRGVLLRSGAAVWGGHDQVRK
jgi:hypothetical protein